MDSCILGLDVISYCGGLSIWWLEGWLWSGVGVGVLPVL